MNKIDWGKPIEAVHRETNKVFPLTINKYDNFGKFYITNEIPNRHETNEYWHEDGSDPCNMKLWFVRNVDEQPSGPSIRDQFAMAALSGLCTQSQINGMSHRSSETAEKAYRIADAMIAERNKGN